MDTLKDIFLGLGFLFLSVCSYYFLLWLANYLSAL